ncbi:hypothetical protein D3C71_824420 [compost metagenome]
MTGQGARSKPAHRQAKAADEILRRIGLPSERRASPSVDRSPNESESGNCCVLHGAGGVCPCRRHAGAVGEGTRALSAGLGRRLPCLRDRRFAAHPAGQDPRLLLHPPREFPHDTEFGPVLRGHLPVLRSAPRVAALDGRGTGRGSGLAGLLLLCHVRHLGACLRVRRGPVGDRPDDPSGTVHDGSWARGKQQPRSGRRRLAGVAGSWCTPGRHALLSRATGFSGVGQFPDPAGLRLEIDPHRLRARVRQHARRRLACRSARGPCPHRGQGPSESRDPGLHRPRLARTACDDRRVRVSPARRCARHAAQAPADHPAQRQVPAPPDRRTAGVRQGRAATADGPPRHHRPAAPAGRHFRLRRRPVRAAEQPLSLPPFRANAPRDRPGRKAHAAGAAEPAVQRRQVHARRCGDLVGHGPARGARLCLELRGQ